MLKILLFSILVFFVRPAAAERLMSYEKFMTLDRAQQEKVVIALMQYVVDVEARYKHEVRTTGFNPERFRRYTDFMKSVSAILFPEAHAAGVRNVRYGQYLHQLREITQGSGRNKCLYGGWISTMVSTPQGPKCTHPKNGGYRSLYQDENCGGGNNRISCNPAIFGFKNINQKTLFCVAAGEGQADNSSKYCMQLALQDPPPAGASSREDRIRNIIAGIAVNPLDSNAVFDFLLRACACNAGASPSMNEHYLNYMRPHQTCYSILRMMSEFTPDCRTGSEPLMDSNQQSFLATIKDLLTQPEIESPSVASTYNTRLSALFSRSDYQAICGPIAILSGGDTGNQCPEAKRKQDGSCCEENQIANPADRTACIPDPNGPNPDDDNITVEDPPGGDSPGNDTPGGDTPGGDTPGGDVPGGNTDPNDSGPQTCANGASNPPSCDTCGAGKHLNEATPPVCVDDPAADCGNGAVAPECTTCPAGKHMNDADPPVCVDDPTCPNGAVSPACTECPTGKHMNDADPPVCEDDPAPSNDGIHLSISGKTKDTTIFTVTLKITPSDAPKDQFTFFWYSKGSNVPTDIVDTRSRTSTGVRLVDNTSAEDDSTDADNTQTETQAPVDPEALEDGQTRLTDNNGQDVRDFQRGDNDYEVCGRLIRKSPRQSIEDKCIKVPKKSVAQPRQGGAFNPFQQQMGPTRGGASNAIFQGIR